MTPRAVAPSAKNTPRGWSVRPLGDITSWMSGGTPSKSNPEFWGGDIPWISAKSLKSFYLSNSEDRVTEAAIADGARIADVGDILLLVRGMTLHNDIPVGIAMRQMTFNQDVKGLRGQTGTATRYIAYWLVCNKRRLLAAVDQASHGTGRLRTEVVQAMEVLLPPPIEQEAITAVLRSLDDKIEHNLRTAKTLERLSRAIFRAWFVDFEPVKAKGDGATSFPSMPQDVFDALPTRFVDSEIGSVPKGWTVGMIRDLAGLSKTQVKPQEYPEEVFDHFSIPAFDSGIRPVVEAGAGIKSNKFLVIEGCVLLSKLNPGTARVWLPPAPGDRRQIASTEFLVFVPGEVSDRHYLYSQFQQTTFREELAQTASGTSNSHQRVRPNDVLQRLIIVPPSSIRSGFASIVDPLFAQIAASRDESSKLAEMRDYLLPLLLSGKVRVEAVNG